MSIMKSIISINAAHVLLPALLWLSACAAADPDAASGGNSVQSAQSGQNVETGGTYDRGNKVFALPYEISLLSKEQQEAYLNETTDEEFKALVENARIMAYLEQHLTESRLKTVGAALPQLGVLTVTNVTPFLSPDEVSALATFENNEAAIGERPAGTIEKSCKSWKYAGTYTSCNALFGFCDYCDWYTRSCDWWEVLASRNDYRNCTRHYYL